MKVKKLVIDNFKAFDHIEIDGDFFSESKYLFVGKNGSGKTTVLEALRFCLATGQDSQQSQYIYGCVRDKQKECKIQAHLELDDDEIKICQAYMASLEADGGPQWSGEEKDKYDPNISKEIISRVIISTPFAGSGQNRTGSISRNQTYLSAPTLELLSDGSYQPQKFHIVSRLFTQNQQHRPLVYLNPFRTVMFQDTMLFQNYQAMAVNQPMGSMNQAINDPIRSVNYAQPEFGKNYFQFSYAAELYTGILGEFYEIAKSDKAIKEKIKRRIAEEMQHINEMIKPKVIDDVEMDLSSNALTYQVSGPDGRYSINGLSAGEEQLVIFGLSLPRYLNVSANEIKPVVIIDEPELHLHPEYCRRLGKFLSDNLPDTKNQQLFIASHSVEIIQQLADCAYHVTATGAEKIKDVLNRTDLFHNLGANFSVADIVNKVVFVEGYDGKGDVSDWQLYQHLADDPYSRKVRFVGVGDKKNVMRVNLKASDWVDFIKTEIDEHNASNVYAVVDGDVLDWVAGTASINPKVLTLPCYSVENLLLQPSIIAKAYPAKTKKEINDAFNACKAQMIDQTAEQIVKEYIATNRRSFIIEGNDDETQLQAKLKTHYEAYQKRVAELPDEFKRKVKTESKWYLFVAGKQLRTEVAKSLSITDSKKDMFTKLMDASMMTDMPKALQEWFKTNIDDVSPIS